MPRTFRSEVWQLSAEPTTSPHPDTLPFATNRADRFLFLAFSIDLTIWIVNPDSRIHHQGGSRTDDPSTPLCPANTLARNPS